MAGAAYPTLAPAVLLCGQLESVTDGSGFFSGTPVDIPPPPPLTFSENCIVIVLMTRPRAPIPSPP